MNAFTSNQLSWVAACTPSYLPGSPLGTSVPTGGAAFTEPRFTEVVDLGAISGMPGVGNEQRWTHALAMQSFVAKETQLKSAEKRNGSGLCPWRPPE